jgi:hypothetical protein
MSASALPYALTSAYETLVKLLEDAAANSNCGLVRMTDPIRACFASHEDNMVIFNCFLHLQEWQARKQHLHILLQVQESIKLGGGEPVLAQSTVTINYFKVKDNQAQLLQALHFDYGPEQKSHPIFHAQLTNEGMVLPSQVAAQIEFEFPQLPCATCFKEARIPTSDMTFPSVLLCLAADHFGEKFFADFFEQLLEVQEKLPQPLFEKTKRSLQATPGHLRSSHWFAHMR